jgi:hypothetical protein
MQSCTFHMPLHSDHKKWTKEFIFSPVTHTKSFRKNSNNLLKGTVSTDFRPLVFFIKQLHLGPWSTGKCCKLIVVQFAYLWFFLIDSPFKGNSSLVHVGLGSPWSVVSILMRGVQGDPNPTCTRLLFPLSAVSLTLPTTVHLPLIYLIQKLHNWAVADDVRKNRLVNGVIETANQFSAVSLTPPTTGQRCH